jgi:fimbrial chaperone protein
MPRLGSSFLLAGLLSALGAAPVRAANFDVAPTLLTLSDKAASTTLVITNRAAEELRFQVTAFAWNQRADGEMILAPTKDIVFFPAMLALRPKEARQIRVGAKVKPGSVERSYRLFVEELPPVARNQKEENNTIRVLTKMGLPVFVQATAPKVTPSLTPLQVSGRELTFSVKNAGNTHLRVQKVLLTARNAGKTVHSEELPAWYVLAGGVRTYSVKLPDAACKAATSLEVQMQSESGSPKTALASFSCGP